MFSIPLFFEFSRGVFIMHTTHTESRIVTLGTFLAAKLCGLFKVSMVIGSFCASFSGSSMILPLVGLFGGVVQSSLLFGALIAARYLFFGISSLSVLAFYVPGWCAALYMGSHHSIIRLLLPLACMLAFVMHPVGGAAWPYTLYWLIPVFVYCFNKHHIFYQALGATFVAHAVGSVIWLYTIGMTADMWLGLIPVVACERLLYAAGMVVAYHAIKGIQSFAVRTYGRVIVDHVA